MDVNNKQGMEYSIVAQWDNCSTELTTYKPLSFAGRNNLIPLTSGTYTLELQNRTHYCYKKRTHSQTSLGCRHDFEDIDSSPGIARVGITGLMAALLE